MTAGDDDARDGGPRIAMTTSAEPETGDEAERAISLGPNR